MSILCQTSNEVMPREWRRLDRHLIAAWRKRRIEEERSLVRELQSRTGLLLTEALTKRFDPGLGLSFRFLDGFGVQLGAVDGRTADRVIAALASGQPVSLSRVAHPGAIWYFELSAPDRLLPLFAGFARAFESDTGGLAVRELMAV